MTADRHTDRHISLGEVHCGVSYCSSFLPFSIKTLWGGIVPFVQQSHNVPLVGPDIQTDRQTDTDKAHYNSLAYPFGAQLMTDTFKDFFISFCFSLYANNSGEACLRISIPEKISQFKLVAIMLNINCTTTSHQGLLHIDKSPSGKLNIQER